MPISKERIKRNLKFAQDAYDKMSHGERRAIVEGWLIAKLIAENPDMVRAHIEALIDLAPGLAE